MGHDWKPRDVTLVLVIVVGALLAATAFTQPWWTRGYSIEEDDVAAAERDRPVFLDTFTVSYGPFQTPSIGPIEFDSARQWAVVLTGLSVSIGLALTGTAATILLGRRMGRTDLSLLLVERLVIAGLLLGLFGTLFALLWPFVGVNGDGIFSRTLVESFTYDSGGTAILAERAYLNAGFFVGLLAFGAYPAAVWYQAAAERGAMTPTRTASTA